MSRDREPHPPRGDHRARPPAVRRRAGPGRPARAGHRATSAAGSRRSAGWLVADRERLVDEIADDTLGHGPLERLLADDTVTEIMVNGPHDVWVERAGKLEQTDVRFTDEAHLRRIINKIVSADRPPHRRVLADGRRAPAGRQPRQRGDPAAVAVGPLLTIRKFSKKRLDLDDLVRLNALSSEARRLPRAVRPRRAQHPRLGRHGHRQDDAAQRDVDRDPGPPAHRHDRGRGGAAAQPAPRPAARGAAEEHRGRGRDRDPRAGAQLAAHATGPHHRRRGPRRRGAGHAPGDEHGPRRLALARSTRTPRATRSPASRRWC